MPEQPPPAFTERPDCPIPYVAKLELPLLDDCDIPEAPDVIYEAPVLEPFIPPPDIGCPPLDMEIEVDELKQEYDWRMVLAAGAGPVTADWLKTADDAGELTLSINPEFTMKYALGLDEPDTDYEDPIEIVGGSKLVVVRIFNSDGEPAPMLHFIHVQFDPVIVPPEHIFGTEAERDLYFTWNPIVEGMYIITMGMYQQAQGGIFVNVSSTPYQAPEAFNENVQPTAKYAKPYPLVEGYAKYNVNVNYRDDDFCAPDIDVQVEVPEIVVPCPEFEFKVGEQKVWDQPHVDIQVQEKMHQRPGCDFEFEILANIPADCVLAENLHAAPVAAGMPMEIVGWGKLPDIEGVPGREYIQIDIASEDSLPAAQIVFPIGEIGALPDYNFGCVHGGVSLILVDYEGADPEIGGDIGVQAGSFKFSAGSTGFRPLAFDPARKKAWVRPLSGGGSDATLGVIEGGATPGPAFFRKIQVFDDGSWSAVPADLFLTGYILDRY